MYFSEPTEFFSGLEKEDYTSAVISECDFWIRLFEDLQKSAEGNTSVVKEVNIQISDLKNSHVENATSFGNNFSQLKYFYDNYHLPLASEFLVVFGPYRTDSSWLTRILTFISILISDKLFKLPDNGLSSYYLFAVICRMKFSDSRIVNLTESVDSARNENLRQTQEVKYIFENLKKDFSNQSEDFSAMKNEFNAEKDKIIKDYESDTAAIKKAFESEIQLRSAVNYWQKKRVKHVKDARNILGLLSFLGPIAVSCAGVIIFMVFVLSETLNKSAIDKNFKYVISAFTITIVIWGIRLAVKMWLSNIHLANDAEERVILVQTYLALQKDNVMPSDDDKRVVVNSLFRQASDGVVRDDGMPNPIVELITRNKP